MSLTVIDDYTTAKIFNLLDRRTALSLLCASKSFSQYERQLNHVRKISIGNYQLAALTYSGKIFVWEIANEKLTEFEHNNGNVFRKVICGAYITAGINEHGKIFMNVTNFPWKIECETGFRDISYSLFAIAAVTSSGELKIWKQMPINFGDIPNIAPDTFRKVKCVFGYIIALTSSGKLVRWGNNTAEITRINLHPQRIHKFACFDRYVAVACDNELKIFLPDNGSILTYILGTGKIISIGMCGQSVIAIDSRGELQIFRDNNDCNLLLIPPDKYSKIACRSNQMVALTQSGKIILWKEREETYGKHPSILHEGALDT